MSAEARYFRVGLFVLVGIAVIVAAVLVLAGGNLFRQPVVAETYFDEAVEGLEVGSPVKLRGVQIGQVSWIGFVDDVYEEADEGSIASCSSYWAVKNTGCDLAQVREVTPRSLH